MSSEDNEDTRLIYCVTCDFLKDELKATLVEMADLKRTIQSSDPGAVKSTYEWADRAQKAEAEIARLREVLNEADFLLSRYLDSETMQRFRSMYTASATKANESK